MGSDPQLELLEIPEDEDYIGGGSAPTAGGSRLPG